MVRRKRRTEVGNAFKLVTDFAETVDILFERLTGKPIATWLKEFQHPQEMPPRAQAGQQPTIPLADAYAIMGLPQTSSIQQVKERYRVLSKLFHPDAPGGYEEAMKLLNKAYECITKERK